MVEQKTKGPKKGPNKRAGEKGRNLRPRTVFTPAKKLQFIGLIAKTGRRIESCAVIGVSSATVSIHLKKYPLFREQVEEAMDVYRDSIDAEVGRRGKDGYREEVWYQGEVVGEKMVYSDQLLIAHAKAHHPAYRDKVQVDQTSTSVSLGLEDLSDQDRADLRNLLKKRAEEHALAQEEERKRVEADTQE